MIRKFRSTTTRLRSRLTSTERHSDEGIGAVEYVLLVVLGILVAGAVALAVTNFVNNQIGQF